MKKLVILFLLFSLILTGCNGDSISTWKQERASAEIEPYARRAIEIIDGYLNFELPADDATKEFDVLYQRIEPYDITGIDSSYSGPDKTVSYIITFLSIGDADKKSDVKYHQYRDILSFQIGGTVSGKSYEADRSGVNECPKLAELFELEQLPVDLVYELEFDSFWACSFVFDEMNGVSLSNFQNYIEDIYAVVASGIVADGSISFYYNRYEQDVFCISLYLIEGKLEGSVTRTGDNVLLAYEQLSEKYTSEEIAAMDSYPKEFDILNPLFEFTDINQLADAIAVCRTFTGAK